jgi:hypothetical protein
MMSAIHQGTMEAKTWDLGPKAAQPRQLHPSKTGDPPNMELSCGGTCQRLAPLPAPRLRHPTPAMEAGNLHYAGTMAETRDCGIQHGRARVIMSPDIPEND